MDDQKIIKEISRNEISTGLYNIYIDGIPIYNYVRRPLCERFLKLNGHPIAQRAAQTSCWEKRKSQLISFFQILWLIISNKKYHNFIFSFHRIEKVNDLYVEKFTDPLIDFSNIGESYIIFEQGRNGNHRKPRIHNKKVIYTDAIDMICIDYSKRKYGQYFKKHNKEFGLLFESIEKTFPDIIYDKEFIKKTVLRRTLETKIYKYLFEKLNINAFFAPSRNNFLPIIPAAKHCNITIYELQHGITYGESVTYSGYRDPMFTPDYFLAFGNMSKTDKYGIDVEKIKVIGFAFNDYLRLINKNDSTISSSDVLLVSDPNISDKMISVCLILAEANPSIHFYYRAHPAEFLTEVQKKKLLTLQNIHLDDNTVNLLVVLQRFTHVLGENSTAIYEALSMGKKVGKLYMEGLTPKDIDKDDPDYFWRIEDAGSFKEFINASPEAKKQRKIYSKFDRKFFEDLMSSI